MTSQLPSDYRIMMWKIPLYLRLARRSNHELHNPYLLLLLFVSYVVIILPCRASACPGQSGRGSLPSPPPPSWQCPVPQTLHHAPLVPSHSLAVCVKRWLVRHYNGQFYNQPFSHSSALLGKDLAIMIGKCLHSFINMYVGCDVYLQEGGTERFESTFWQRGGSAVPETPGQEEGGLLLYGGVLVVHHGQDVLTQVLNCCLQKRKSHSKLLSQYLGPCYWE